jgi:hypothetical protein
MIQMMKSFSLLTQPAETFLLSHVKLQSVEQGYKGIPHEGFDQGAEVLVSIGPTGWNIAQLMTAAGVVST